MTDKIKLAGRYEFYLDGKKLLVKNILISTQINHMKNCLLGYVPPDLSIQYCGLGTGTTAASKSDTLLETEGARVYRTNLYGQGDQIISEFTFTETQAIGTWTEVGLFLGSDVATSSADTGRLYSRAIVSPEIEKPSGKELTIRHVTTWEY